MSKESGAKVASIRLNDRLGAWWLDNRQVATDSLKRLFQKPVGSLMTWLVIGVALALPVILYVALANVEALNQRWDGEPRIQVFLKTDISDEKGVRLGGDIKAWPEVREVKYVSRQQGLEEFQQLSGLPEVLGKLEKNPLPAVLEITPVSEQAEDMERLLERLKVMPQTDLAQLDLQWVKRLSAILQVGQRIVLMLVLLLSVGVLLVIGNTTRLEIQNRHHEIAIIRLIGGTDTFIRRPFLYTGFWYGLGGGLLASVLVAIGLAMLNSPVRILAGLYNSDFSLLYLSLSDTLALWMMAALLGVFGASLSVSRYLDGLESQI